MKEKKAFFGPPVGEHVDGGAHLAMEVITKRRDKVFMVRRPKGLFGQDQGKWFFPHGEFIFGEEPKACAARLTQTVTGLVVKTFVLLDSWSWISEKDGHWSLVLIGAASVTGGRPRLESEVSEGRYFDTEALPKEMAYWSPKDLRKMLLRVA